MPSAESGGAASVELYWDSLFRFARDKEASVRLAFIWASENIATNTPDPYKDYLPLFAELLHDSEDRVRMEAPEIFRVLGKRRPEFVKPYLDLLLNIAETDSNRVVRIHCLGAVKAAGQNDWSFPRRHAQPPLFLVNCNVEIMETDIRQMEPDFFWRVGVHALDHALPFGIHGTMSV